ncbi:MAG TPA: hypothetical protein VF144_17815 [Chitinophagaceae bacterium]
MRFFAIYIVSVLSLTSCGSDASHDIKEKNSSPSKQQAHTKPPATFNDTLPIDIPAAVFYLPDSLQLEKIKELTDSAIFDATMHEYFFQIRNARKSITRDWPQVKIIEAKNVRYLLFKGKGSDSTPIDLNTKNDSHGLFLFQPGKKPHYADMMNIDTELGYYFSNLK